MRRPLSCGDAERVSYVRPSPGFRPTLTTLRETAAVRLPGWDGRGDAVVAVEDSPMTDVNGSQVGVIQCGSSFLFLRHVLCITIPLSFASHFAYHIFIFLPVAFCVSHFNFPSDHILCIPLSCASHFAYHISTFVRITCYVSHFNFPSDHILCITFPVSCASRFAYHVSAVADRRVARLRCADHVAAQGSYQFPPHCVATDDRRQISAEPIRPHGRFVQLPGSVIRESVLSPRSPDPIGRPGHYRWGQHLFLRFKIAA